MSKHEKLAYRLSIILCRLNTGERLDYTNLPKNFKSTSAPFSATSMNGWIF